MKIIETVQAALWPARTPLKRGVNERAPGAADWKVRAPAMLRALLCLSVLWTASDSLANPQGLTISSGTASVTVNGNQYDITVSHNAFLNWQSFNIAAGETTTFHQPSAASIVWNRINDPNPSQIWGHLNANGIVVLMNQSGFFFGPGSVVNAAGFVATTASTLPDFSIGGVWQFNGPPPLASIINYGEVHVQSGGSLFLIAEKIENHGTLTAPDGTLGLYAGKEVMMSERPDGRGLSVNVQLPEGSIDNQGRLIADAGSIYLHAQTVNQNGLIQANSVRERNGVIELIASESVNLGSGSSIQARGDDAAVSPGGQVLIKSDGSFTDAAGSQMAIGGGTPGGNGGRAEISAPFMPWILTSVDGRAAAGSLGGVLVIDPTDINLNTTGTGSAGSGTVGANDPPGTLNLNVNSAFVGLSQIVLEATRNITLQTGTTWDLSQSTGVSAPGSLLSLQAGNNITFQNGSSLLAGLGWSVSLMAGADFSNPGTVLAGVGSILFQGSSSLQGQNGSLSLLAGKDVTVNSGFVRTMAGGSIDVTAVSGSVNTGTRANGFLFSASDNPQLENYLLVDPNLGGISTYAGGNVNITAGQDITSFLPTGTQTQPTDGGCGAFGAQAGNVTLTAGGNINGHYVVRNGVGTINAGGNAGMVNRPGSTDRPLALSLVSGGWDVHAGNNILLQEVRNPNGIFNSLNYQGRSATATRHYFDYSPNAYVNLTAANGIEITGGGPRRSGTFEQGIPAIFAPTLNLRAGAGGIEIDNDIRLFPSASGQLNITTTDGGSLSGTRAGGLVNIVMSDSARSQYTSADGSDFGADDHGPALLHFNDPNAVRLDIAGDMNSIFLAAPKHTEITVGGNMQDSRFSIQNLHATDVSSVNVAGDIRNQSEFTTVHLDSAPDFSLLDHAYPPLPANLANLAGRFHYDPVTHLLSFQGRMTDQEEQTLMSLQVQAYDPVYHTPLFDAQGNPILQVVSIFNPAQVQALYDASKAVPESPGTGYTIAGPGSLNISARNMDLGDTLGLQSIGPEANHALTAAGSSGAAINVHLTGDLDMFSTTISSLAGGNVNVYADGTINVGSSVFTGDELARGIFTVSKADVSVVAGGDINVNGSRIAAYDGGNVTVLSLHGNVDAGHGGQGSVEVTKVIVDPTTGEVKTYTPTIPGSGILATTFPASLDPSFPNSLNAVGNIRVETPEGNITANSGGIVQVALNHVKSPNASVTLIAGTRDENGNVVYEGSIDASGSGVIGGNVNLSATDGVKGLVVAQQNININAGQNVSVTAIGAGNVSVSAGGNISGTIVGVGSVSASGSSIDAALLSQNVSASGNTSAAQLGFSQGTAAAATSQSSANSDEEMKKTVVKGDGEETDDKKKHGGGTAPEIVRRVGRVTVLLPNN
jgi:filamentous hemagglutinin family protein